MPATLQVKIGGTKPIRKERTVNKRKATPQKPEGAESEKSAHEQEHETEGTGFRVILAFAFWAITALIIWGITLWLNSWIAPWFAEKLYPKENSPIDSWYLIATMAIWLWLFFTTMEWFLVTVPKVTGLVSLNLLTHNLHNFGPGLHCRYPWDNYDFKEDSVSLDVVTVKHDASYADLDGPSMHVTWLYQYYPRLSQIHIYIKIAESTIQDGFSGIIGGKISQEIAKRKAKAARSEMDKMGNDVLVAIEAPESGTANGKMENEVLVAIEAPESGTANGKKETQSMKSKLENMYGVNFKLVTIEDVDYSPDYQKALEASAGAKEFTNTAKAIKSKLTKLDDQTTANVILAIQGRGTRKSISIEGLGGNNNAGGENFAKTAAAMGAVLAETIKEDLRNKPETEGGQ